MSNLAMLLRRQKMPSRRYNNFSKRHAHATRPGYGMGMGKNTLIHKGRKP